MIAVSYEFTEQPNEQVLLTVTTVTAIEQTYRALSGAEDLDGLHRTQLIPACYRMTKETALKVMKLFYPNLNADVHEAQLFRSVKYALKYPSHEVFATNPPNAEDRNRAVINQSTLAWMGFPICAWSQDSLEPEDQLPSHVWNWLRCSQVTTEYPLIHFLNKERLQDYISQDLTPLEFYIKVTGSYNAHSVCMTENGEYDSTFTPFCSEGFRNFVRIGGPGGRNPAVGEVVKVTVTPEPRTLPSSTGMMCFGLNTGMRKFTEGGAWETHDSIYGSFYQWVLTNTNYFNSHFNILTGLARAKFTVELAGDLTTLEDAIQQARQNPRDSVGINQVISTLMLREWNEAGRPEESDLHPGYRADAQCNCLECLEQRVDYYDRNSTRNAVGFERMISRVYPPDPPRAPADISQGVPEDEEEVIKEVAAILKRLQLTQLRTDRLMRGLQALSENKEENQFPLDDDSSIDDCVAWMIQTTAHTEAEFAVAFINEGAISAIDIRDQSSYRLDWYDEEELSERINEEVGERIRNAREALDDC